MTSIQWAVIVAGVLGIALVNWYYFAPRAGVAAARASDGTQSVRITVRGGYDPQTVRVRKGAPVRLIFDRQETSPCSEEVVLADFGVRQFLTPFKETSITVTPDRAGNYEITCGMSMLHGKLVVED